VLPWAAVLPDYSFPSGHTMNALVFYLALALIAWSIAGRRAGLLAVLVAAVIVLGVGVSRIYLGFHYFTDVVGGVLAGLAWLLIAVTAVRARPAWRQWRSPSPSPSQRTEEEVPT
jgi:undecaprenyl-diphosphatase